MKKIALAFLAILVLASFAPLVLAKGGYDEWGYNYQANMFNGWYENYQRPTTPVEEGEIWLMMKWNDAWLDENKVRHEGYPTYDGSGAWLTNHMRGINDDDGSKWEYFVKIITPSTDAGDYKDAGMWYHADGSEIGYVIWTNFAVIQEFENNYHATYNPDGINHFVFYHSPLPVGFGAYPADELP